MTNKNNRKHPRLILNLSILCFILGVGIQLYNYFTFKKYNWTLVKEKVAIQNSLNKSFKLSPNLDTEYELILFYKKLIPEIEKGQILDPSLSYNVEVKHKKDLIWQKKIQGHSDYSVNLKGVEVIVGKFNLNANKEYSLSLEVDGPTIYKDKEVMLSLVTNQAIFQKYFYKAGVYELLFFLMFILSFVFFMIFIIFPKQEQD